MTDDPILSSLKNISWLSCGGNLESVLSVVVDLQNGLKGVIRGAEFSNTLPDVDSSLDGIYVQSEEKRNSMISLSTEWLDHSPSLDKQMKIELMKVQVHNIWRFIEGSRFRKRITKL